MRRLITKITPQDLNKSLLTLNKMVDNDLNITYDYSDITKAYTAYEYYFNQLMEAIGADYRMKVQLTFTHNNFIRINLISNNNPINKAHLDIVNEPLRFATEMFLSFEEELRDLYDDYYSQYNTTYDAHLSSIDSYTSLYNELTNTLKDLEQQAAQAGITQGEVITAEREAITEADSTIKGYSDSLEDMLNEIENTTKSDEQARAEEAAYYASKDAEASDRGTAALQGAFIDVGTANARANDAENALQEAREAQLAALDEQRQAETDYNQAKSAYDAAAQASSWAAAGTLPAAGETRTETDPNTGNVTTVHNNGDGTYSVSNYNTETHISTTRQYDQEELDNGSAARGWVQVVNEADEALERANENYKNATDEVATKSGEYYDAKANAEEAKSNMDNISDLYDTPFSSGDELDNWEYTGDSEGVAETDESIVNDFDFGD